MALRNISNNMNEQQHHFNYALIKPINQMQLNDNYVKLTNCQQASTSSASSSSSTASSIQIRTSSPISSSDSSELSGPVNISPSKFLNAVHMSRKNTKPELKHYTSIKQLAFDKLRKQQALDNDLREHFNTNMNQLASDQKMKSMGKLKISIYNNVTHLTCHIVEARSLKINTPTPTFVKVSIIPDFHKSFSNIRTQSIKPSLNQTNGKISYLYDSKFSFETCQLSDLSNRIVISVWTESQMIGCFSFKLKHLIENQKPKYVWYHMLPLKFGLNKHLKCAVKKIEPKVTNVNKDLIGMEKVAFSVQKESEGDSYGFTITSGCPCMVGKVDLDKVAFRAGIRPGDYISKINGVNVSRATCESVVKMIKTSKIRIVVEVHRQKSVENYVQCNRQVNREINQLESVPEEVEDYEDEDDLEFNEDDEEEYYEEEEMRVGKQSEENYFKMIQNSIRYVDSVSSNEFVNSTVDSDERVSNAEDDAERMRRAAVQFYSTNSKQAGRQANVRYLKPNSNQQFY